MGKILEKLMKKYRKNAKKTGKVREIRQSKKVGTMILIHATRLSSASFTRRKNVRIRRVAGKQLIVLICSLIRSTTYYFFSLKRIFVILFSKTLPVYYITHLLYCYLPTGR